MGADAITLHPYLGREALTPFLERKDKGCIILCKTSNPGSGEFQDIVPARSDLADQQGPTLSEYVARQVLTQWNTNSNCLLVIGATYPEELANIRKIVGDMTLLVPGIGAQGGDVEKTMSAGLNSNGTGMIINSSRGVIYATDPREASVSLRDEINAYRKK